MGVGFLLKVKEPLPALLCQNSSVEHSRSFQFFHHLFPSQLSTLTSCYCPLAPPAASILNTPSMPSHTLYWLLRMSYPSSLSVDSYILQDQMLFPLRNHPFLLQAKLSIPSRLSALAYAPTPVNTPWVYWTVSSQPQNLLLVKSLVNVYWTKHSLSIGWKQCYFFSN